MLSNKQKRFLRSESHHLKAILQVGKGGVSENLVQQVDEALEAREMIKLSVLQNCEEDKNDVAAQLAERTGAQIVQVIGSTMILYKASVNKKQYDLENLERMQ